MLSERRQRVLRALIEDYIEYALPVGSRTLTERHRLGVSPATVRNDLSALEDAGFIQQPHTSAGRVPTDAGYRTFVDELLSSGLAEDERPHQAMVDELRASASELDALMERTSSALTRLTDCLSIVLAPSVLAGLHSSASRSCRFRRTAPSWCWSPRTARCSTARWTSPRRCPPTSWRACRRFCAEVLRRASRLQQIEDGLAPGHGRGVPRPARAHGARRGDRVLGELRKRSCAHRLGVRSLLTKPEFSQSQALLPVMQVLEDDTVLLQILDDAAAAGRARPACASGARTTRRSSRASRWWPAATGAASRRASSPSSGPRAWTIREGHPAVRIASAALQDVVDVHGTATSARRRTRKGTMHLQWPQGSVRSSGRLPRRHRRRDQEGVPSSRARSFTPT